jgi:hypothetical protein
LFPKIEYFTMKNRHWMPSLEVLEEKRLKAADLAEYVVAKGPGFAIVSDEQPACDSAAAKVQAAATERSAIAPVVAPKTASALKASHVSAAAKADDDADEKESDDTETDDSDDSDSTETDDTDDNESNDSDDNETDGSDDNESDGSDDNETDDHENDDTDDNGTDDSDDNQNDDMDGSDTDDNDDGETDDMDDGASVSSSALSDSSHAGAIHAATEQRDASQDVLTSTQIDSLRSAALKSNLSTGDAPGERAVNVSRPVTESAQPDPNLIDAALDGPRESHEEHGCQPAEDSFDWKATELDPGTADLAFDNLDLAIDASAAL